MNIRTIARTHWPALALLALTPLAHAALPEHNVAKGLQVSNDKGRVAPSAAQTLTVVLKHHNQAEYDKAVEALYEPGSPTFHKWFTDADFAKYAPTAAELKTVREELEKQGLSVLSVDAQNFSVRVHGTTASTEKAFQTELHTFTRKQTTFQAHIKDAQLTGEAGLLVDSVVGLDRHKVIPQLLTSKNPRTGKPLMKKRITAATVGQVLASSITDVALTPAQVNVYDTPGAPLPVGVYYGTIYDAAYNTPAQLEVALTPKQLQTHYGLSSLLKSGYDGTGQTIALVEGYGYPAAEFDANTAFKTFGLPLLTSKTFAEVFPEGKPFFVNAGYETGWATEIALDVQSAHSIAPGARILEVATAGQDDEDFINALEYVISKKLANVVSNSWEVDQEAFAGSAEANAFNTVLQRAAASGISVQFSSGDGGDEGIGQPLGAPGIPSDAPYAVAVGGTSVLNNPNGGADVVAGWGDDYTYVNLGGPTDPPNDYNEGITFFGGGAGGGESIFFPKPSWQKALPGKGRQVPDVSALADPNTGFPIIFTAFDENNQLSQFASIYGGTSLASPIFTATWAIADQYNGKPLGLASPILARLKAGQITDVQPNTPINNADVAGTVYDANGATFYSAVDLFANASPGQTQTVFPSALFNLFSDEALAISFGTDTSLTVAKGWDNVTGYGEPNGLPFIQGVTGKTKGAPLAKK